MPNCSWMRFPNGSLVGLTTPSFIKRCLFTLRWSAWRNTRGICQGHQQPSPERSPLVEVSAMGLLTPQTMLEEILALYQEVYQLRRDPGEVQRSDDTVEETWTEILGTLKECLWYRQDPTQPEESKEPLGHRQKWNTTLKHRQHATTLTPA